MKFKEKISLKQKETEQAMLRATGKVIVVADSSKFGRKSLTLVSGLEAIDIVVSDNGLSKEWQQTTLIHIKELLTTDTNDYFYKEQIENIRDLINNSRIKMEEMEEEMST